MPETIFETERLLVRDWRLEDAEDAFAMYGDPEVSRTLPDEMAHASVDETRGWLARKVVARNTTPVSKLGFWAVVERESGRVIGGALLEHAPINAGNPVEIGYHFARSAWGQGYATELGHALLRYGFEVAGLQQIVAAVLPDNTASRYVLEKLGMRYDGPGVYAGFPLDVFVIDPGVMSIDHCSSSCRTTYT